MTSKIPLPGPRVEGESSLEESMRERRSVREFAGKSLSLQAVAQILWAAQGVTSSEGQRTVPSAGALYPLEVYLVAGNVDGVDAGVYQYRPRSHELRLHVSGDRRNTLAKAALRQAWVGDGAAVLVIAAVYQRTATKYGSRANRYVPMEAGHAAQNVYLQATSLGLATVIVGAFEDDAVREVLALPENEVPLALMPLGWPR